MIIKREDLYEKLLEECPGKYGIGLHGISVSRVKEFFDVSTDMDNADISEMAAKRIIENGLNIYHGRTINGTVQFFGRLDDALSLKKVFTGLTQYHYGSNRDYIIVATPVEFASEDGRSFYIGSPNLDSPYSQYFDSTGSETTTIADKLLDAKGSYIDKKFILGRFKVLEDGTIDLEINDEHISKNNGLVSTQMYDEYLERFKLTLPFGLDSIFTAYASGKPSALKEAQKYISYFPMQTAYFLETLNQYINEYKIDPLQPEDYETIENLKQAYRNLLEEDRKYREEKAKYYESLKSYTLEQIQEFALKNPTSFKDFPEETRNNVELMRKLLKTPNLSPSLIWYLGDDVRNDKEAMLNLANHCSPLKFEYHKQGIPQKDESDLFYSDYIGIDVKTEPLFWDTLNVRIIEINKEFHRTIPLFDTEKELRLANEQKAKNQSQK